MGMIERLEQALRLNRLPQASRIIANSLVRALFPVCLQLHLSPVCVHFEVEERIYNALAAPCSAVLGSPRGKAHRCGE